MWGMEAGEGRKDQEQAQLMHLKFILKIKIYPENQAIKRLSNKWDHQILISVYPEEIIRQVPKDMLSRMFV